MENTAAAYGVYCDAVEVAEVVRRLNKAGFDNEDILLMFAPTHPIAAVMRDASIFNVDREAGAVTAGWIGWLSRFGAVVIPSIGYFIRANTFLGPVTATRDASALCGSSRTLAGLGFADIDAQRFETQLRRAGFLVYVAVKEVPGVHRALELFRLTGAEESARIEPQARMETRAAAVA